MWWERVWVCGSGEERGEISIKRAGISVSLFGVLVLYCTVL